MACTRPLPQFVVTLFSLLLLCGCESKSPPPPPASNAPEISAAPRAAAGNVTAASPATPLVAPIANAPRILIDSIHAHNSIEHGLEPGVYEYHQTAGYCTAIGYLRARGIGCDEIKSGSLDPATLAKYKMLFINLVSADLPPYSVPEIAAIKSFVESGGSLLVIVDHTNCYFHAYKLGPLMQELGIELHTDSACDKAPRTLGSSCTWITITNFKPHPITQGLQVIAMQTGGTVDDRYAIATTSEAAWADNWSVHPYSADDNPGMFGNGKFDPGERTGKLGVVLARELGKGKIVVVGDQNMLSDNFIRYAENYKLWLNTVAWLMDGGDPASAAGWASLRDPRAFVQWKSPRILCCENYENSSFGATDPNQFFYFYSYLLRSRWTFASDDLSGEADLMILGGDQPRLAPAKLDALIAHLRAGRNILMLQSTGFAAVTGDGVTGQLKAKLGKPQILETSKTLVATYPQVSGRIVLMRDSELLQNGRFSAPTVAPDAAQKGRETIVEAIIEAMLPGGSLQHPAAAKPANP